MSKEQRAIEIKKEICNIMGISTQNMESSSRKREDVIARHTYSYLAYKALGFTYEVIGRQLGGRDHATILHGVRGYEDYLFSKQIPKDLSDLVEKVMITYGEHKSQPINKLSHGERMYLNGLVMRNTISIDEKNFIAKHLVDKKIRLYDIIKEKIFA